jgi:serine/threonine protein phosphatase PrpC
MRASIKRFLDNSPSGDPALILRGAILEANRIIVLRRQNQAFGQMGTTLVGAIFSDREVSISHVGDSRAYLVGRNGIRQLTVDHTYVQELVNRGEVSQEDALHHPQAHVLTKAIGSEAALDVKASTYWIWDAPSSSEQDYLVMCTDGLYSMVSDAEIEQAVLELSPQAACAHLIDLSKQRGGYDNITLAVIPLTGELHEQAPSGYVPSARKRLVAEQKEKHLPADWKMFVVKNMLLIFGLTALLLLGVFIAILIFLRG